MEVQIRPMKENEVDDVVALWLESSKKAHAFIPDVYWEEKAEDMRKLYIPNAKTWVSIHDDEQVTGFFSLHEHTLAAIFVALTKQHKGIGKQLMQKAKSLRSYLELCVYKENHAAIAFYKKQGFQQLYQQWDHATGQPEIKMCWSTI